VRTFADVDVRLVHQWVDELAEVNQAGDRACLEAAAGYIRRVRNWLDGRETVVAAALAAAVSFPEKNLADAGHMHLRDADRVVSRAATLDDAAPMFAAALAQGVVSGRHVDVYQRVAGQLPEPAQERFADMEARHVGVAERATPQEFARTLRRDAERLLSEADKESRLARQKSQVRLHTWVDTDGMGHWRAVWDPETMVMLDAAITQLTDTLHHGPAPDAAPTDAMDRQSFLRAHALLKLIDGGGVKLAAPQAVVVVHSDGNGGALVDFDLPVDLPRSVVSQLLERADIRAVVVDGARIVSAPGRVALGRSARCAHTDQRLALRAVYSACTIPGCRVRIRDCEAHHVNVEWSAGGHTDLDNLAPVCRHHHDVIHTQGWRLRMAADRSLTITLPDGSVMSTGPPGLSGS
jgi:hypothetical protein